VESVTIFSEAEVWYLAGVLSKGCVRQTKSQVDIFGHKRAGEILQMALSSMRERPSSRITGETAHAVPWLTSISSPHKIRIWDKRMLFLSGLWFLNSMSL
jgi:hypothetical protein